MDNEFLNAALGYAAQGLYVFPIKPRGKTPLTNHGFKDASTDPEQVRAWWTQWPDANIGIATGKKSGLFVIDVDGDIPSDSIPLPDKPTVITAKGHHYYFEYLEGQDIRSRTKINGLPVDVRGEGGYIVAPPSIHPEGGRYEFVTE
jgi:hypothetical protein